MPDKPATGPIILHHIQDLEEGLKLLTSRVERVLQREQLRGELMQQLTDPALELQRNLTRVVTGQEELRREIASLRAILELHVSSAGLERERAA